LGGVGDGIGGGCKTIVEEKKTKERGQLFPGTQLGVKGDGVKKKSGKMGSRTSHWHRGGAEAEKRDRAAGNLGCAGSSQERQKKRKGGE